MGEGPRRLGHAGWGGMGSPEIGRGAPPGPRADGGGRDHQRKERLIKDLRGGTRRGGAGARRGGWQSGVSPLGSGAPRAASRGSGPAPPPEPGVGGPSFRSPRATARQLTKFVDGIQGSFRVTVLLIPLICPSLSPADGQHLNAGTRGGAGGERSADGREEKMVLYLDS